MATAYSECAQPVAHVTILEGEVEASTASAVWQPVSADRGLCAGTRLRTGPYARASLSLTTGNTIRLGPNSALTLQATDDEDQSRVGIFKGIAHFFKRSKRALEVITPYVNAGTEGTEFVVMVTTDATRIALLEGTVTASNEYGELRVKAGQVAVAKADSAPILTFEITPEHAVRWAADYQLLPGIRPTPAEVSQAHRGAVETALEHYRDGDIAGAINALPPPATDPNIDVFRAGLLLSIARVDKADALLDTAKDDPDSAARAYALLTMIAVAESRVEPALNHSQKAVERDPQLAAAWLARSYAHQAAFNLTEASEAAHRAAELAPETPLVWSRRAELALMHGDSTAAVEHAERALELNQQFAPALEILGYSQLAAGSITDADETFARAAALSPQAPMIRLGQGLTEIRQGNAVEGRKLIELAATMDPRDATIRAYLAKVYMSEGRRELAAEQLRLARQWDPQDPTGWFYEALNLHAQYRPIEAERALRTAVALNGNRAVYRSRFRLDEDMAVRDTGLARIYQDLGFHAAAQDEAIMAIAEDPSNYAAHRFLADTYAARPGYETARLSELLQAQLWQPLNLQPLQPGITTDPPGVVRDLAPTDAGYRDYGALFMSNGAQLSANAIVGGDGLFGEELMASGLYDRFMISASQFHYELDGFRPNMDRREDAQGVFTQAQLSAADSLQLAWRHSDREQGDIHPHMRPQAFSPSLRRTTEEHTWRAGWTHRSTPGTQFLTSLMWQDVDASYSDSQPGVTVDTESRRDTGTVELQAQHRLNGYAQFVGGAGAQRGESTTDTDTLIDVAGTTVTDTNRETENVRHDNLYLYAYFGTDRYRWTTGMSYDHYKRGVIERAQTNPKLAFLWQPTATVTARFAAYRSMMRDMIGQQTVEPAHMAGFPQFFNEVHGSDSRNAGIAVNVQPNDRTTLGMDTLYRNIEVPFEDGTGANARQSEEHWESRRLRVYGYLLPTDYMAVSLESHFHKLNRDEQLIESNMIRTLETVHAPLSLKLFHGGNMSSEAVANFVRQQAHFLDPSTGMSERDSAKFASLDVEFTKKFFDNKSSIQIGLKNVFDRHFDYEQTDEGTYELYPRRLIYGRVQLSF